MEKWQEKVEEIYEKTLEGGVTKEEAQKVSLAYIKVYPSIQILNKKLTLRKFISCQKLKKVLGSDSKAWEGLQENLRKDFFWELGFDTREYEVLEDIGYFIEDEKRQYGEFLFGNERTDEEWIKRRSDGSYSASLEARLFNSKNGVKEEMDAMSKSSTWDLVEKNL